MYVIMLNANYTHIYIFEIEWSKKKRMIKYAHTRSQQRRMPHSICVVCAGGDQQQFLVHRMLIESKQMKK